MITQELFGFKKVFDQKLEEFFNSKIKEAQEFKETSEGMLKVLKDFTMGGGKRLRPALVYYAYLCFSDENEDEAIKAGIPLELVQSFLLIHDDIMDSDDLRRGRPTVHSVYSEYFGDTHLGTSLAIICGDIAITLANEALMSLGAPADRIVRACKILNEILNKVGFGQELDIISAKEKYVPEEELFLIHNLKTAMYTFEAPLKTGAILAGAKKEEMKAFEDYSGPLGQAFQLQDDILGLFGDQEKLGKPIGSDIREGKKTLLIIKAREKCGVGDRVFLDSVLGKPDAALSEIEKVRDIVIKTGSLDYSRKKIAELISKSRKAIENEKFYEPGKKFLLDLTCFLKDRDY